MEVPPLVVAAKERADAAGFTLSCEDGVGRFLATLAAAVPDGGWIFEIGTGAGVGLAWIAHGIGGRTDVRVISAEVDPERYALAASHDWPATFTLHEASIFDLYEELGVFDLVFADSGAGKWSGLDETIGLVRPGGLLLMDDMTPPKWNFDRHEALCAEVRERILGHPELVACELAFASGVLLAAKRS